MYNFTGWVAGPNPASGQVWIDVRDPFLLQSAGLRLELYDLSGRLVYAARVSDQRQSISLEGLDSGLYFARMTDVNSGDHGLIKLIVQ